MKITEITVNAGRTFNNPYESYSNLRPEVTLRASLSDGDNPDECAKGLQAQAEQLVEKHKTQLLMDLDRLNRRSHMTRDIARLESDMEKATAHLADLKAEQEADGGQQVMLLNPDE